MLRCWFPRLKLASSHPSKKFKGRKLIYTLFEKVGARGNLMRQHACIHAEPWRIDYLVSLSQTGLGSEKSCLASRKHRVQRQQSGTVVDTGELYPRKMPINQMVHNIQMIIINLAGTYIAEISKSEPRTFTCMVVDSTKPSIQIRMPPWIWFGRWDGQIYKLASPAWKPPLWTKLQIHSVGFGETTSQTASVGPSSSPGGYHNYCVRLATQVTIK